MGKGRRSGPSLTRREAATKLPPGLRRSQAADSLPPASALHGALAANFAAETRRVRQHREPAEERDPTTPHPRRIPNGIPSSSPGLGRVRGPTPGNPSHPLPNLNEVASSAAFSSTPSSLPNRVRGTGLIRRTPGRGQSSARQRRFSPNQDRLGDRENPVSMDGLEPPDERIQARLFSSWGDTYPVTKLGHRQGAEEPRHRRGRLPARAIAWGRSSGPGR